MKIRLCLNYTWTMNIVDALSLTHGSLACFFLLSLTSSLSQGTVVSMATRRSVDAE